MVTIDSLKEYIYIPRDSHADDGLLATALDAASVYIQNACDNYESLYENNENFRKQADLAITIHAAEIFNNRLLMSGKDARPNFFVQGLILQLQSFEAPEGSK